MAPKYGFPKANRLRKRADYLSLANKSAGRLFFAGYVVVVQPNNGPQSRLGVTVTRRIGRAVVRNRFKRLAREYFRLRSPLWPSGLDILFIASKKASLLWPPQPLEMERLDKFLNKFSGQLAQPRPGGQSEG
ncbi:MAG: ribonuclease P protein component [Deltaproteobacteria bacterium]|jgi:ribonuclease P protein component|nr:ribonuclease P protein component [Deltaproteobacteria bacterium]